MCDVKGNVPEPRAFHSCCLVKEFLVIYGGILQNSQTINDLFVFDINKEEFSQVKNDVIPPCYSHSSLVMGKKIVIFGGFKNALSGDDIAKDLENSVMLNKQLLSIDTFYTIYFE